MLASLGYLLLACATVVVAAPENISRHHSDCPSVWGKVANELKSTLVGRDGALTDNGRASVRVLFHDCFPGACDGSIILANECTDRSENGQMIPICGILGQKAKDFNVGTADIIQLAGALSIRAAGGPALAFYAGRRDSSIANPAATLNSDTAVSKAPATSGTWSGFAGDAGAWESTFLPAMQKMTTMGNDIGSLTDCSRVITDMF